MKLWCSFVDVWVSRLVFQVVKMIKRIPVEDLKIGMYVEDLNCNWTQHKFLRNHFMIRKQEDLEKFKTFPVKEVLINTIKGLDVVEKCSISMHQPINISHQEELPIANAIRSEAFEVVSNMLNDVRMGRQVELEKTEPVVTRITDSILRNPGTLVSLCRLKEGDTYTFQHCVSVATLLVAFCHFIGMQKELLIEAGMGGILHDVGKMKIPDHILNKPGKLEEEEFEIMKSHVAHGIDILCTTAGISPRMIQIASEHHERYDGSGYPKGLVGKEISQIGKMAAIVDVYDAITSNRVYHKSIEPIVAIQNLYTWSEHHFDPELVEQFIKSIGIYPIGSLVRLTSGRLGVIIDQGQSGLLFPLVRMVFDTNRHKLLSNYDVDLSNPDIPGDQITNEEDPFEWRIDPFSIMGIKGHFDRTN